ncbi:hypothetical protein HMI56_004133 [Coelomomyces lativittatus]|nr:hypothetical protein HMI56_004133 [Coelomomyces lativittatus]
MKISIQLNLLLCILLHLAFVREMNGGIFKMKGNKLNCLDCFSFFRHRNRKEGKNYLRVCNEREMEEYISKCGIVREPSSKNVKSSSEAVETSFENVKSSSETVKPSSENLKPLINHEVSANVKIAIIGEGIYLNDDHLNLPYLGHSSGLANSDVADIFVCSKGYTPKKNIKCTSIPFDVEAFSKDLDGKDRLFTIFIIFLTITFLF